LPLIDFLKQLLKIFSIITFIGVFFQCKKDKNVLGVDVQPTNDALNTGFNSNSPIFAYTQKYDSIFIINNRYKYLGINRDPYFGTTEVGLYLNANIPDGKTYVSFGADANITSAEIILTAFNLGASYVGNLTAQLTYSVFPIVSDLLPAQLYYSNVSTLYNPQVVLGAFTGTYSVLNGKIVLRIPIDNNFANAILTNPQYLYSNAAFQNTYKGFYIKCKLTNDDGVITKFDLEDDLSGFYLYYQNGAPSATKVDKSFRFVFGGDNPIRFNSMSQDFQGASNSLKQQILSKDSTKGADNLFLKGMGVSKVKVYLPSLKNFSDSFKVAVNRAEVVFNVDPSFSSGIGYRPPAKLCLLPVDSINRETFALDQTSALDAIRYNGNYDSTNKRYVFNIARHVQAILSGARKNNGFYLVVANTDNLLTYKNYYQVPAKELLLVARDNYIERVVLAGSNNALLKPVLNLSYVKIKHD
jgi:hypothetical protein